MKRNWTSLAAMGAMASACLALGAAPAHAQGFSFGYAGPGVSVGITTGGPGYYGVPYYGGGYYSAYPVVPTRSIVVSPVAPVLVRPRVIVPGPWIGPPGYVVRRPYGWYGPYPRYYRWW